MQWHTLEEVRIANGAAPPVCNQLTAASITCLQRWCLVMVAPSVELIPILMLQMSCVCRVRRALAEGRQACAG